MWPDLSPTTPKEEHPFSADIERAGTGIHSGPHQVPQDKVLATLGTLESKLSRILNVHIQDVKELRESAVDGWESAVRSPESAVTFVEARNIGTAKHNLQVSRMNSHVEHIDEFFDDYVKNVRRLQDRLKGDQAAGTLTSNPHDEEHESIRRQFETQLLVSTFSATLIISFCSFVKGLLLEGAYARHLFNASLLLSFFGISCNIFNMSISGRCASLVVDKHFVQTHDVEYFRFNLWICEHLYMMGIYLFTATLLMMSYGVFDHAVYPTSYCSAVAFVFVSMFFTKLRDVLVIYRTMRRVQQLFATLFSGRRRSR